MEVVRTQITEERIPDYPLGRHIEHDPQSRQFNVTQLKARATIQSVSHLRHGKPFNQGNLGSCTGNAVAGAINTDPLFGKHRKTLLYEKDAVALYELATVLDGFSGTYPPDDTGSSGLAAAKAALQKKLIGSYHHAFTVADAVNALMTTPVITGVNWYEGFDRPDSNGFVSIAGQVRGGHEFEIKGYQLSTSADRLDDLVMAENSWGSGWGKGGMFCFTVHTWAQLLSEQGDVTVLAA